MGSRLQLEMHGGHAAMCLSGYTNTSLCLLVIKRVTRVRSGKGCSHDTPEQSLGLRSAQKHRVTG